MAKSWPNQLAARGELLDDRKVWRDVCNSWSRRAFPLAVAYIHRLRVKLMINPYESPDSSNCEITSSPIWYVWFYNCYVPAWWIGTALIACSWFGIVSPTIGWIGFGVAGFVTVGSYIFPALAGAKDEDYAILDSRLLNTRNEAYHDALERFRNGASLVYDGVAFGFRPNNEIACAVVAYSVELDDSSAMELASYAKTVFGKLMSECPEFKSAVNGRKFRISIMSSNDENARELCRIVDGNIDWLC